MSTQRPFNSMSDNDLVILVRTKDKEKYEHVVERYQAKLLRYVKTIVHDEEKSKDVVQNTFIKAFVNLNSFNEKKQFSSWIYRIAHNESINFIKKHSKEFNPDDESWFDTIVSDQKAIEEIYDSKVKRENIIKTIKQINSKYRDPLWLHYFDGKSYQEISDILRLPVATVGTRISRAKSQLKDKLEQERRQK